MTKHELFFALKIFVHYKYLNNSYVSTLWHHQFVTNALTSFQHSQ